MMAAVPALDENLGLEEGIEDLAVEKLFATRRIAPPDYAALTSLPRSHLVAAGHPAPDAILLWGGKSPYDPHSAAAGHRDSTGVLRSHRESTDDA